MNSIIQQDGAAFDIKPWNYAKAIDLVSAGIITPEELALLHVDCLSDLVCVAQTSGAKYAQSVLEDVRQSVHKAAAIELPTEADLAYYDAQAEAMGVPSKPVAKPTVRMARVTLFVDGEDITGQWETLKVDTFARQCGTLAALGMAFSVEYRDRAL